MAMLPATSLIQARAIFGADLVGPEEIGRTLDTDPAMLAQARPDVLASVPYALPALEAAHARGELLILRVPSDGSGPLTILRLNERFPGVIQERLMKGVGYQLRDEWTLRQEPFAHKETCRLEWRLVQGAPLEETCNLSYAAQDEAMERYASAIGLVGRLTRRSAVEATYDAVLLARAKGTRVLERSWDWTSTATTDGAYVAVGDFAPEGMHLVGYSRAVRFGTLGACAQH